MVPPEKIIDTAINENVDIIGLSGLITPSLDEMVTLVKELEKIGFKTPVLIGGATTSRTHTAVKIAPEYSGSVIYVNDASKAVPVATKLLSDDRDNFVKDIRSKYEEVRDKFLKRKVEKNFISISEARKNKYVIEWEKEVIYKSNNIGVNTLEIDDLSILRGYIDWTQFFRSWNLHGIYPDIFNYEANGKEAKQLFDDANSLLEEIIKNKLLRARAVYSIFPANSVGDDIEVYNDEKRKKVVAHFLTLRQQVKKSSRIPNIALSDFIAPKNSSKKDYIGTFCVSTGFGSDELCKKYEDDNDDYSSIMVKALADRLVEAFAEYLHKQIRTSIWGYAKDEATTNEDLIKEKYVGIRPAPGYPACPDHLEKSTLWKLMDVEKNIGVKLTENLAMWPASSVSGYYFANNNAKYFGLGKISNDQVIDYAKRRKITIEKAKKWLNPNINDV